MADCDNLDLVFIINITFYIYKMFNISEHCDRC